jgi:hypothetical protein
MYRLRTLENWVCEQEHLDSRSNSALNPVNAVYERRPDASVRF